MTSRDGMGNPAPMEPGQFILAQLMEGQGRIEKGIDEVKSEVRELRASDHSLHMRVSDVELKSDTADTEHRTRINHQEMQMVQVKALVFKLALAVVVLGAGSDIAVRLL